MFNVFLIESPFQIFSWSYLVFDWKGCHIESHSIFFWRNYTYKCLIEFHKQRDSVEKPWLRYCNVSLLHFNEHVFCQKLARNAVVWIIFTLTMITNKSEISTFLLQKCWNKTWQKSSDIFLLKIFLRQKSMLSLVDFKNWNRVQLTLLTYNTLAQQCQTNYIYHINQMTTMFESVKLIFCFKQSSVGLTMYTWFDPIHHQFILFFFSLKKI